MLRVLRAYDSSSLRYIAEAVSLGSVARKSLQENFRILQMSFSYSLYYQTS